MLTNGEKRGIISVDFSKGVGTMNAISLVFEIIIISVVILPVITGFENSAVCRATENRA